MILTAAAHEVSVAQKPRQQPWISVSAEFGAGGLLTGIAVAQLAGEDFLTGRAASASMRQYSRSRRNCRMTPFRSLRRPASQGGQADSRRKGEGRTAVWLPWRLPSSRMSSWA